MVEALGVKLNLPPARLAACLEEVGIAFLFAPAMHSAMKYVQPARRELRLRTVFNLLGPLTNPARASAQVVGVYARDLVDKLAEALRLLGLDRALVVHGSDGLDEITITGPTHVAEVRDGTRCASMTSPPRISACQRARLEAISGGDVKANADIIRGDSDGRAFGPARRRSVERRRRAGRRRACRYHRRMPCRWPLTPSIPATPASSWKPWSASPPRTGSASPLSS